MISRTSLGLAALATILVASGCERDLNPLDLAPFPSDPEIFTDNFGSGVDFQAFGGSKVDALSVDQNEKFSGSSALRIAVPAPGDPSGGYAGGAFVANVARDLSTYDAVTFWAKASTPVTLNTVGLGNDNTGNSKFTAEIAALPLTSTWTKFAVPIPGPTKLTQEAGLFYFAEGAEGSEAYDIWFDEVKFESLGTLANPRPAIPTTTQTGIVGSTITVSGTQVTYDVAGTDVTVNAAASYFSFTSSDQSVATVDSEGGITIVGDGTAEITATLNGVPAAGVVTVGTGAEPTTAAPAPTQPAGSVVSMFSNAYTDVAVDTWRTSWSDAGTTLTETTVAGDDVKLYQGLVFVGIEATTAPIDASAMTDFHMDIWTPDPTADPATFKIKLVDFGADGAFGGGDDVEHEVTLSDSSTPAIGTGSWVSLDIPLSDFTGLTTRGNIAQMILVSDPNTVYVDNVYFYSSAAPPTAPTVPAPAPTAPSTSVVSMFSNAYTDVAVDTWRTPWSDAGTTLTETTVAGDDVKLYEGFVFVGIEATTTPIDASAMTDFHMDIWTPDPTADPATFKIKLVDFGADAAFGGGDDVEHEITLSDSSTPAIGTGSWVSLDIPLSDFTGLTTRGNIAQMVLVSDPNTVYVDNVYFYDSAPTPTAPTVAAPSPMQPAGTVVSMFSNAYTDVAVDTWRTSWSDAGTTLTETTVAGDDVKLYEGFVFVGIEATTAPIDASAMTDFHMDIWTPDPTADPATFKIKLVDFGADGAFGGGDDVEHEVTLSDSSTPAIGTGSWVSLDIPLSDFTGLTTRGNIAQMILVSDPNTVYVDNVYFYATAPTAAAPAPSLPAGNVVSMFSNAYTDVAVDTWRTSWSDAGTTLTETTVAGDDVKLYQGFVFVGIEATTTPIDASAMTDFHMDIWTPDATEAPATFKIKLVDFGADGAFGGGDDVEHEVTLSDSSTPAIGSGNWISLDIPLSDFTGLTTRSNIAQMILVSDPNTVYVDNVYFHN